MKKMFETDKNKVCTYIFHWIKSITLEENLSWVEEAIDQYFKDHSMQVRLATSQSNKTRRHSLIRIAVAKGTQSTKEKFKDVEERVFGWTLKMDVGVHPSSRDQKKIKTYLEMMASENYILVRLDPSIVPKSRKKTPLYWLKRANAAEEENVPNISTMLDVIVDAVASSEDLSFGELVQMLQDKVDRHDKGDSSAQELPYDPNTGTANVAVDGPNHGKNAPMEDQMENLFVRFELLIDTYCSSLLTLLYLCRSLRIGTLLCLSLLLQCKKQTLSVIPRYLKRVKLLLTRLFPLKL
jgi:hypothetical protein